MFDVFDITKRTIFSSWETDFRWTSTWKLIDWLESWHRLNQSTYKRLLIKFWMKDIEVQFKKESFLIFEQTQYHLCHKSSDHHFWKWNQLTQNCLNFTNLRKTVLAIKSWMRNSIGSWREKLFRRMTKEDILCFWNIVSFKKMKQNVKTCFPRDGQHKLGLWLNRKWGEWNG